MMLSEKAEETQLIRMILEKIVLLDEAPSLIESVLEQISILKNIPYCAYCRLQGTHVQQISVYSASSSREFSGTELRLPENIAVGSDDRFYQLNGPDFMKLNPFLHAEGECLIPTHAAFFPFTGETIPAGMFVFIDDDPDTGRFVAMSDLLQSIIHIVVERIDKISMAANLKELNRELAETQRMSSLGQLVAGVAHEVNTPLGNTITAMTLLRDDISSMDSGERRTRFLEVADLAVRNLYRSSGLIEKFKKLTTDNLDNRSIRIDLMEFLRSTVLPRVRYTDSNIRNEILIQGPDHCIMQTYPDAIVQVLINLIINACVHGYQGQPEETVMIQVIPEDSMVAIHVSDNGAGMTETVQSRMYDPFFVSDRRAGGSGLGLTIVYNTTYGKLNGCLRCVSAPGDGTDISIVIPLEIEDSDTDTAGACE